MIAQSSLRFLGLSFAIVFALAFASYSSVLFAHSDNVERLDTIAVVGVGKIEVVPDEVRFSIGVDDKAPQVQPAYERVEKLTSDVLKLLRRLGVQERDIQAMAVQIIPVIDYKSKERNIIGHEVRRDISVKVNDVAVYAEAVQKLAELGVTRFNQVQMSVSNEEELAIQALEKAYVNAEEKAQRLAGKGARNIKDLIVLVEGGASHPQPHYKTQHRAMAMESDMSSAATVSAGVVIISRSVQATFSLE